MALISAVGWIGAGRDMVSLWDRRVAVRKKRRGQIWESLWEHMGTGNNPVTALITAEAFLLPTAQN